MPGTVSEVSATLVESTMWRRPLGVKTRAKEEARSSELESTFEKNELETAALQEALNKRLGSLKELFGVLQQVAGDTTGQFQTSIISSQYENRGEFLTKLAKKMGTSSELASIEEIERLWFELQREMTESGNVVRYNHSIISATLPVSLSYFWYPMANT